MGKLNSKTLHKTLIFSLGFFLCVYLISYISPLFFPPLFFNELLVIGSVIVLPALSVASYFINKKISLAYIATTLLFLPFYFSTFSISNKQETSSDLRVLTFNTSYFRVFSTPQDQYRLSDIVTSSSQMVKWVSEYKGDIMCFQEYFYDKNAPIFTTTDQFTKQGFTHHYISSNEPSAGFFSRSVAIFSRHPIVNQGDIFVDKNNYNRGVFADITIGNDTIRFINIHLHSNEFDKHAPKLGLMKQYIVNSITRGNQAQAVLELIEKTKYPIILCGDFNQTVYSYTYQKFNNKLNNAFESKGNGIGATLNSEKLSFLRIDHQFSSDEFNIDSYEVKKEMKLSHHFPLECTYSFK